MSLHFCAALIAGAVAVFEDSFYIPAFVQRYLDIDPVALMATLSDTAPWNDPAHEFMYRGHELAREKAFLVRYDDAVHFDEPPAMLRKYTRRWSVTVPCKPFQRAAATLDLQRRARCHQSRHFDPLPRRVR